MAKYRLRAQHVYKDGRILEPGTEVGDDTPYLYDEPSTAMEGIDDDGRKRVNELHQRLYGRDATFSVLPDDAVASKEALEAELASDPVSEQQRREREPPTQQGPLPTPQAGTRPATPKPPEDPRPEKPNKDMPPKDQG